MAATDRAVRKSHEDFLAGADVSSLGPGVRGLVADSWRRSRAAGVVPERVAPMALDRGELDEYRGGHPLSAVFPLLYDVLGRAAEDCDCVMAVGDTEGRLLWVCGRPTVLRQAEHINFAEGTWWDETHAGTNAPGTALRLDTPVQIEAAEHFVLPVQRWSCAAAPIHDPETQRILGVVDVTGGPEAASPQSLAMVRSAARMAEAEIGRLIVVRRTMPGVDTAADEGVAAAGLGRPDCEITTAGRTLRLSRRHSEILAVLADAVAGLSGDQLALEIYGEGVSSSTTRAELVRMRALLGDRVLTSRPYRLAVPVRADWLDVARDLDAGLVRSALRAYRGPLLPQSEAPGVVARRDRLERQLRQAIVAAHDVDLLASWTRSRWGGDDLEAWERQLALLPPSSPLAAMSRQEVARLRRVYGVAY